ncbi:MAG TPA: chlorite dismutase family protein [Spirochaetia bacterium]|nr:chlorite dismutase family protein [Spirochaetia bacterium]
MADVARVTPAAPATASLDVAARGLDLDEKGRPINGEPQRLARRLFVQLLVFDGCAEPDRVRDALDRAGIHGVLYEDVNDPRGIGVLAYDEDPAYFLDAVRPLALGEAFRGLHLREEYTMLGRTYSMGWEADLEEALLARPRKNLADPSLKWAVWYPLRRSGSFEELPEAEQRAVLAEHGGVGRQFGKAGVAHDVRLACHGLSKEDNDFIIGILGSELFPLSAVVQRMRKTRQTARYLARLGPFFVGRVRWQAPQA